MRQLHSLLRFFFHLLYHPFAWTYDLVAALVSLGHWKGWVLSALPFLEGRVLEIGYGPGHLQLALHAHGFATFGLDESQQMSRLAERRLRLKGFPVRLARAYAQHLPFAANAFDTLVATFPSGYIFEADTLAETRRVLAPAGRLVIIPTAWITGRGIHERLAAGLFKLSGEAGAIEAVMSSISARLQANGFNVRHELLECPGSKVLVIIAVNGLEPSKA
jgi:ubiquinone/menaquinone biosynthesis C-methylase UbiE